MAKAKYSEDQYVPEGRKAPKMNRKEKGLVIDRDLMKQKCSDLDIDSFWGKKKCIKRIKKEYRKENEVLYTSECSGISNPFKRKACVQKYNRGL